MALRLFNGRIQNSLDMNNWWDIDSPALPFVGQVFMMEGVTFMWSGTEWLCNNPNVPRVTSPLYGGPAIPTGVPTGSTGPQGPQGPQGPYTTIGGQLIPDELYNHNFLSGLTGASAVMDPNGTIAIAPYSTGFESLQLNGKSVRICQGCNHLFATFSHEILCKRCETAKIETAAREEAVKNYRYTDPNELWDLERVE